MKNVKHANLLLSIINYVDCHAKDLSHLIQHRASILGIDYFVSPVINRATDFLHHLIIVPHFLEALVDDLVNHAASLALPYARDVSPD